MMQQDNVPPDESQIFNFVKVRVLPGNRVTPRTAGTAMNKSLKTLANWRCKGIGPRYHKVGGHVLYDWPDVQAMASGTKPISSALEFTA